MTSGARQQVFRRIAAEPAAAIEAAVAVLVTATELLAALIRTGLMTSLLSEAWPEDFAGEIAEETIT